MINHDYRVVIGDSREMAEVNDGSIHLIVTSPPYPMVAIWDDFFTERSGERSSEYSSLEESLVSTLETRRGPAMDCSISILTIQE